MVMMMMMMMMMIMVVMYSCYSKMDRASIRMIERALLEIPYFYPPQPALTSATVTGS
jgi:hypothetical protein